MADVRAIFNSAVKTSLLELLGMLRVLRNEKVKAISTLASGQDLLAVLKRYRMHFYLMPKCCLFQYVFFSLAGRLCSGGFYVLTNQMWFCICFTLRGHDTLIDLLWFLNFWSARFTLWCKSIFFDLFRSVNLFLVAQQERLLGPLFLSKVSQIRIWITKRFSSSPWMWCFPVMLYHTGPSSLVLQLQKHFLWPLFRSK